MVSALGKTVRVWRRSKKKELISDDQLGVWHAEFTNTYVNKPLMVLDASVESAASSVTAVAGLPDVHGVRNPEFDLLLNGDVTMDEVRYAMGEREIRDLI
jgi:hypothetical protein